MAYLFHRTRTIAQIVGKSGAGQPFALGLIMTGTNRFVYILKSRREDGRLYIGVTNDVASRIAAHNSGHYAQTASHRPWALHVAMAFADEPTAVRFERFLKSRSGRVFASRYFI